MKATYKVVLLALALVINPALAGIWTPADLVNPPVGPGNSIGSNPDNPSIQVRQRLPVGDTMTATLTTGGNVVIVNADGSTPTYQGTVGAGTQGISFLIPGIVNGSIVKDIHQTHTNPNIPDGILEVAAFVDDGLGGLEAAGLGGWLSDNSYVGSNILTIPDFITSGIDLFYGVDLVSWSTNGFAVDDSLLGTDFSIVNGTSASLPGFLFSTTPLSYVSSGWESSSPFSGTATLDSFHEMSVPEPSSFALLGIGAVLVPAMRKRVSRSKSSKKMT